MSVGPPSRRVKGIYVKNIECVAFLQLVCMCVIYFTAQMLVYIKFDITTHNPENTSPQLLLDVH
jgi:hypothetical protein